jgi:methylmalonyl-CoA mutase
LLGGHAEVQFDLDLGYHMHEAGATAVQELGLHPRPTAWTMSAARAQGLDVTPFAPRLSFFFGIGMNFFMEVAEAARGAPALWAGS